MCAKSQDQPPAPLPVPSHPLPLAPPALKLSHLPSQWHSVSVSLLLQSSGIMFSLTGKLWYVFYIDTKF